MEWRASERTGRRELRRVRCGADGSEVSEADERGHLFAVLPASVELSREHGWRSCGDALPLYNEGDARLWLRWPVEEAGEEMWDEDVRATLGVLDGVTPAVPFVMSDGVSIRAVESEEDVRSVMTVLRSKFGAAGELWYEPAEICESFVRSGVFVVCVSEADGPVGCCGAARLSESVFAMDETVVDGKKYNVRPGWELTHYAVLGTAGGRYAGVAREMQIVLLRRLASLATEPQLVLLDTTYDRAKSDGGGAWKLGARDNRFIRAAVMPRFTVILVDPKRHDWRDKNHLIVYYCIV